MSERWPGGLISKTPVTPTGPSYNGTAPGIWTIDQMNYWKSRGLWPDPAIVPDPYWSYVSYLLSTTATNAQQNNTFLDSSTNNFTITRFGNTTQGSATPYGSLWSNYFPGSGYIYAASGTAQGTGDFTVEGWFNVSDYSTGPIFYDARPTSTNGAYIAVALDTPGYLSLYVNTAYQIQGTTAVVRNTWNHFAVARSGTSTKLFLNGVQQGSTYTDTNNYLMGASRPIMAGNGYVPGGASAFTGYISNIRAVNGTALYTTSFTPPTSPLTAISGTTLLTCQSNRFKDNSSANVAITASGAAQVTAFSPFILAYPGYTTAANGGSAYFDGSGDYLTAPSNAAFNILSGGDFTVEAWVNFTSLSDNGGAGAAIMGRTGTLGAGIGWVFRCTPTAIQFVYPGLSANSQSFTFSTNTWYHLVAQRSGTTLYYYVNGTRYTPSYSDRTTDASTDTMAIGRSGNDSSNSFAYLNGYIANARIVKGTAVYSGATITPPTAPVTAISGASILCNFTNAGIYDAAMQNNMETAGGAQVNAAQAKYGPTSVYFNGSTDWLSMPNKDTHNFGTGDFTIESWLYPTTTNSQATPASNYNGPSDGWSLRLGSTGLVFGWGDTGLLTGSSNVTQNAWNHVAITRAGTALRMFINGIQVASATNSTNFTTTGALFVGRLRTATGGFFWAGYVDDLRITKGYARYTANFTPPAAALPVY